jgi:hypothetical protein
MISATSENASLPVCPDAKDSVTICVHCHANQAKRKFCSKSCRLASRRKAKAVCKECGTNSAKRTFCSNACRQAAHRKSPAHTACLKRDKDWRRARKLAHGTLRNRDRAIGPFPVHSGPLNDSIPRLGQFWISPTGKRMNLEKEKNA